MKRKNLEFLSILYITFQYFVSRASHDREEMPASLILSSPIESSPKRVIPTQNQLERSTADSTLEQKDTPDVGADGSSVTNSAASIYSVDQSTISKSHETVKNGSASDET